MVCRFDEVSRHVRPTIRRGLPAVASSISLMLGAAGCSEPVEQLIAEAAAMREAGNVRAAAIKLGAALTPRPKNIAARLLAVQIYVDLDRGDAALELLMRARKDEIDRRQIVKLWAQAEFVAQRYQEVLDDTADLPEELPGPVRASLLAYRGGVLRALGQTAAAQRAFEDGLAADPHSVEVRVIAGRMAIDRDDIEANPESTGTYIALAELKAKTGHPTAGEAVLLKGVQAVASDPEIIVALARLRLSADEPRQALTSATEALKKFPRNPALLDIAGNAQLALGQDDDALSAFKNLIDVAPDFAAGHRLGQDLFGAVHARQSAMADG
jgi:tetratricopeptide (TPR) repeat protein